ncbi:hypothetical protein TNCV_2378291 [Trichonephila clavipes]|nr:hypothetical protein TNCV_2378291 [Trichonephila clavipes]
MAQWQPSDMSKTSFSHICCHSWQGSKEPFFNKIILLGHTQQQYHKTASATLPPFPGLLDLQICHQSRTSGIIWDGKLDRLRVWSNSRRIYSNCGMRYLRTSYPASMPVRIASYIHATGSPTE